MAVREKVSKRRPRGVIGQGLVTARLAREAKQAEGDAGRAVGGRLGRKTLRGRRIGLTKRIW